MGSKEERESELTERELWGHVFKRLVLWTVKKHKMNPADAEETVQEGIRQFLQSGGVADTANPKSLLEALGSRINGIAVNRRRKKADRAVRPTVDGALPEVADAPDPEARVVGDHIARKAISALLDRTEADDLATAVVMQTLDGVEGAADQAEALGRDVQDVYRARRRLKTHQEAVKKLMETW